MSEKVIHLIWDLINLVHLQGIYVAQWMDEYSREEICEAFLNNMIDFAKDYNIKYNSDLEQYRESKEDEKYELQDRLAYDLYEVIRNHIIRQILKYTKEEDV